MAILIEATSVIIQTDSIVRKLSGGWDEFVSIIPNNTFCSDNELACISFMTPDDVKYFTDKLEDLGLVYINNDEAQDFTVADQLHGILTNTSWLEFGHVKLDNDPNKQIAAARLVNSKENQIFMPDDWDYEYSLSKSYGFSPTESQMKGLTFLRHEDGVDVYFNELIGQEVYVGRTGKS